MTPAMSQAMTAAMATTLNQVASTNDVTHVPQLLLWVANCHTDGSLVDLVAKRLGL